MDLEVDRAARHDEIGDDDAASPIVVGVNRSVAARAAASWAAVEARDRGVAVRLVAVVAHDYERSQAEDSLRWARAAVERAAPTVRIEEAVRFGDPSDVLVDESFCAAMVCVGTRHRIGTPVEPTVTTVVERARSAVAVIRPEDFTGTAGSGTVSVVLDDTPDNDTVVATAMREGRLRNAVVRQIDHRVDSWVRRFPDVPVEIVADGSGQAPHPRDGDRARLAVMPQTDAAQLVGVTSPCYHPIAGYPDLSMLFVPTDRPRRHPDSAASPDLDSKDPT